MQWLDRLLITNPQTPGINMKFFAAYDPRVGFRFAVERLHGLTQKMPHLVISSIAPPSSLYKAQPRRTQDVAFFTYYNPDNPWNSLQFNEEAINYAGLAPSLRLGFVLDVKALKITGSSFELKDVGWSYVPVFDTLENEDGSRNIYTNSGLFAVRLTM